MATHVFTNDIQKIYIAYYGRPADREGLEYWQQRLDDVGGDWNEIAGAFASSDEFVGRYFIYPYPTSEDLINNIYQQAFNRDADPVGMEYYKNLLDHHNSLEEITTSLETLAIRILDGAQGVDLDVLNNKLEVANYYTEQLENSNQQYVGNGAANKAAEMLQTVSQEPSTVEQQKNFLVDFGGFLPTDPDQYIAPDLDQGYQTRYEFDGNLDGQLDAVDTYTFNDNDQAIRADLDSDVDGLIDKIITFEYDEQGYLTTRYIDSDADGQLDSITYYEYQMIDGGDSLDEDSSYSYFWNTESTSFKPTYGNAKVAQIKIDNDLDGTADYIRNFSYTDQGKQTLYEIDSDADGIAEYYLAYEYDEQGNQTLYERDSNGDGIIDNKEASYYNYDAWGNLIRKEIDYHGDGVVDFIYVADYDGASNQISSSKDVDNDGQDDEITISQYNSDGNIVYYSMDDDGDGEIDWYKEYEYNDEGQVVSEVVNTGFGITSHTYYEYDEEGREIRKFTDGLYEKFGWSDELIIREYDQFGNLVESILDEKIDGEYEEYSATQYDESGLQISYSSYTSNPQNYDSSIDGEKIEERYDDQGNLIFVGIGLVDGHADMLSID